MARRNYYSFDPYPLGPVAQIMPAPGIRKTQLEAELAAKFPDMVFECHETLNRTMVRVSQSCSGGTASRAASFSMGDSWEAVQPLVDAVRQEAKYREEQERDRAYYAAKIAEAQAAQGRPSFTYWGGGGAAPRYDWEAAKSDIQDAKPIQDMISARMNEAMEAMALSAFNLPVPPRYTRRNPWVDDAEPAAPAQKPLPVTELSVAGRRKISFSEDE